MDRGVEIPGSHGPLAKLYQHADRVWHELRSIEATQIVRQKQRERNLQTDTPSKREARERMLEREQTHMGNAVKLGQPIQAHIGEPEDAKGR